MKILYVVNVDWFFVSHRLPLALEAKKKGWEVVIVCGETTKRREIENHNIQFKSWNLTRSGINIINEIKALFYLAKIIKYEKPDIIHNVGIKSVIYGSIVSRLYKKPYVNALAGLGFTYGSNLKAKVIKLIIEPFFKFYFQANNTILIVQNNDDKEYFLKNGFVNSLNIKLIKGSGVDLKKFKFQPEKENSIPIVCLASRMLWDKGINEFIESITIFRETYPNYTVRFVLAGGVDYENPASIQKKQILKWEENKIIEWWGHQENMPELLASVNIIVLPSYREGLPKVLLEAAAVGRFIITTDVPGCREIIKDGINGLIIPKKNSQSLMSAISRGLTNKNLRESCINSGLDIIKEQYTIETIIEQTFEIYLKLINKNPNLND
jgi:glycosyltransferase involved in cell wall biosynthesis